MRNIIIAAMFAIIAAFAAPAQAHSGDIGVDTGYSEEISYDADVNGTDGFEYGEIEFITDFDITTDFSYNDADGYDVDFGDIDGYEYEPAMYVDGVDFD